MTIGDKDDRVPDETTFQIEFKKSLGVKLSYTIQSCQNHAWQRWQVRRTPTSMEKMGKRMKLKERACELCPVHQNGRDTLKCERISSFKYLYFNVYSALIH